MNWTTQEDYYDTEDCDKQAKPVEVIVKPDHLNLGEAICVVLMFITTLFALPLAAYTRSKMYMRMMRIKIL